MKKLFTVIAILSLAFVANAGQKKDMKWTPTNVDTCILFDASSQQVDTFSGSTGAICGPYELTDANGGVMYKGFDLFALPPSSGTTKKIEILYQILPFSSTTADTCHAWTVVDTLTASGLNTYVDLSSHAGKSIVFLFYNLYGGTAVIGDYVVASFKKDETYSVAR